jgi:Zn finger protein HypA/HybF involved in hydrogenase expression
MHDLHVANKVSKMVLEEAAQNNLKAVKKIVIDLGSVVEHGANISKENLEFNLSLLNKGTIAENAEIVVNEVAGDDWRLVSIAGDDLSS